MTYVIQPNEWEQIDEDTRQYYDENLMMLVELVHDTYPYNRPWERILYSGYKLLASSLTYADENNVYYYDALSEEYACNPVATRADTSYFFDDNGDLLPVEIPEWLLETMRDRMDEDAQAGDDFYEWAQGLTEPHFDNFDEMHASAWNWYAGRYVNGGQYPYGADNMLYIGEQLGCIVGYNGGYIVNY